MAPELSDRVRAWRDRGRAELHRGREIHVFERPGDGPPLLLLHGFPSSSFDWRGLLDELPQRRALAFDCPRLRPLREAARPRLHARLAGGPGDRAGPRADRGRAGVHRRPRHGHLGRHRAARPRPARRARVRARRGAALQRLDRARPRQPHLVAAAASRPARAARVAALERARLPQAVRRPVLRRAPAHRRGGRRPVGADLPQRRADARPPADPLPRRARAAEPSAGTGRSATGPERSASPGAFRTRSRPPRCSRR